ncbi:MAG: glycosyltransferase [Alphaproteobacteria bacterium]
MSRQALLITPHFPPDSSAASHRVRLLAPHLDAFGWVPTVLTLEPDAYEGALDPDLLRLVPDRISVVRAPAWRAAVTRRAGFGDLGLRALTGLRRHARRLLGTGRFEALFITTYPIYPALLGPGLRAAYRVPFVLDVQDPWVGAWGRDVGGGPGGRPDIRSRLARRVAVLMEQYVVRSADAITAVSARTASDMLGRVPSAAPVTHAALPLGFEPADLDYVRRHPRPPRHFESSPDAVHLVYVGTVLPTGLVVVRALLAGLARLRRDHPAAGRRIRLHFIGSSNQRLPGQPHRVLPLAAEFGLSDAVHEHPERVDYLDALDAQIRADGLLLLGSTEPHYTPSKAYPAYLSGRPILALYHRESSVVGFLRGCAAAEVLTYEDRVDPDALAGEVARALDRLVLRARDGAAPPAPDAAAPWSARAVAAQLARVFDAVAAGGRP